MLSYWSMKNSEQTKNSKSALKQSTIPTSLQINVNILIINK